MRTQDKKLDLSFHLKFNDDDIYLPKARGDNFQLSFII